MAPRPRRELINVKLPAGFDPSKHQASLLKLIAEKHGAGWEIDNINPAAGTATASRMVELIEVDQSEADSDTIEVRLTRNTKPSDGEKTAAKLEAQYDGYALTVFEPFLGYAIMRRLSPAAARARGALAVALGVKPWEIQIEEEPTGGFSFTLPRSYVPSKHDDKLTEVAEQVVGQPGWYVKTDPQALHAQMIPSEPPTFPGMIPYPLKRLAHADPMRSPFGVKLPPNGDEKGQEAYLDWGAGFALVAGTPGSGKSVTLNAIIADSLAAGAELAIGDETSKSIDFIWAKDFVRAGGWGCASLAATVTMLAMVYEEGQKRARVLERAGVVNWLELPASQRFRPILVVVDEVSALVVADKPPSGIPKDHPLYVEAAENALLAASIQSYITKIISQQRFVGIRMVLSTQVTNATTGVSPSLKNKIGHKILQGSNPSRAARTQAFNDETAVPQVPANVRADVSVARGVGAAELEGQGPFIYKSYFATTAQYRESLLSLGVPQTSRPEPTAAEIARWAPTLMDEDGEPAPRFHEEKRFGANDRPQRREDGLSGAAAAAHDLRVAAGS